MTRRFRIFRAFGPLIMALQLVLAPMLSLADGLLEQRAGSPSVVHVEDHASAACRLAPRKSGVKQSRRLSAHFAAARAPAKLRRNCTRTTVPLVLPRLAF